MVPDVAARPVAVGLRAEVAMIGVEISAVLLAAVALRDAATSAAPQGAAGPRCVATSVVLLPDAAAMIAAPLLRAAVLPAVATSVVLRVAAMIGVATFAGLRAVAVLLAVATSAVRRVAAMIGVAISAVPRVAAETTDAPVLRVVVLRDGVTSAVLRVVAAMDAATSAVPRAVVISVALRAGAISVVLRQDVAAMIAVPLLRAVVLRDAAISADRRVALLSVATTGVRSKISGAARARRIVVPPVNRNAAMTGVRRVRRKASAVDSAAALAPAGSAAALVGLADGALVLAASARRVLERELRLAAATIVVRKPARVTGAKPLARATAIGATAIGAKPVAPPLRGTKVPGRVATSVAARRKAAVPVPARALVATSVVLPKAAVVLAPVARGLVATSGAVPMPAAVAPVRAKAVRVKAVPARAAATKAGVVLRPAMRAWTTPR